MMTLNKITNELKLQKKQNKRANEQRKWKRSWIAMIIGYISKPQSSRYASKYDNYSSENSIYLYAYPIKHGRRVENDVSYKIYNTRCDMKNIDNFPDYFYKHFRRGNIVNAYVVTNKSKKYHDRIITKIKSYD